MDLRMCRWCGASSLQRDPLVAYFAILFSPGVSFMCISVLLVGRETGPREIISPGVWESTRSGQCTLCKNKFRANERDNVSCSNRIRFRALAVQVASVASVAPYQVSSFLRSRRRSLPRRCRLTIINDWQVAPLYFYGYRAKGEGTKGRRWKINFHRNRSLEKAEGEIEILINF